MTPNEKRAYKWLSHLYRALNARTLRDVERALDEDEYQKVDWKELDDEVRQERDDALHRANIMLQRN